MAATKADPSALVAKLEVEYPCSWSLENAEQRIRLCATGLGFLPGQHVYDILAEPILDYGQTVRVSIEPIQAGYECILFKSLDPESFASTVGSLDPKQLFISLPPVLSRSTVSINPTNGFYERLGLGDTHCQRQSLWLKMSQAYQDRSHHSFSRNDRQLALTCATHALIEGTCNQDLALLRAGATLFARDRWADSASGDLACSLIMLRYAHGMSHDDRSDPSPFCTELGVALWDHYEQFGEARDLDTSISLLENALALGTEKHKDAARIAHALGSTHSLRFQLHGKMEDADENIRLMDLSARLSIPGHVFRPAALLGKANSFSERYQRSGNVVDLNRSIETLREGIRACLSSQHPMFPVFLNQLGIQFNYRFMERGEITDLNESIASVREAVDVMPLSRPPKANLAIALQSRFKREGRIDDLDECIQLFRYCLNTCPRGSPGRGGDAGNLGGALIIRFENTHDFQDVEEAVSLLRLCAELHPAGNQYWAPSRFELANALKLRYEHMSSMGSLEEAIQLHTLCLQHLTATDMAREGHQHFVSLAELRRLRYEGAHNIEDLQIAIQYHEKAMAVRPKGHINTVLALNAMANLYRMRAELLQSSDDAEKALTLQTQALQGALVGQRDRARILFGLSHVYLCQGLADRSLNQALTTYCQAVTDSHCSAQMRLSEGLKIIHHLHEAVVREAAAQDIQVHLLEAYHLTVHLLPRIAYFGLNAHSRFRVLAQAPDLAANAAAYALLVSTPQTALETLEEGRAVFWTQYQRLRSSFTGLPNELASELTRLAGDLDSGVAEQVPATLIRDNSDVSIYEDQASRRRQKGEAYEALLADARLTPGFERFMLNETFSTLSLAAQSSPVVVLLATADFIGAILLRASDSAPEVLQFDSTMDVTQLTKMTRTLRRSSQAARNVLAPRAMKPSRLSAKTYYGYFEGMWNKIMRHIIKALRLQQRAGRLRSRLVICATGPFSHMPLHAAGSEEEGCWTYCVPSYTPTLGALLAARKTLGTVRRNEALTLLASVPKPFKWSPLTQTVKEVGALREILPSHLVRVIPFVPHGANGEGIGSATSSEVLAQLPSATILHLACHGYHDQANPLQSGFVMADKMLTISELMALRLPHAFMAFLSACETARVADDQPDQAVHMAAAMLFTGFKSVIGTMWSMDDVDGPVVAKRVYEEIFQADQECLEADIIPYALDAAIAELRGQNLHPSRWAPYVHYGV